MSKNSNFIIIGTAENFDELVNGVHFREYLFELSKTHTIVALNEVILSCGLDLELIDIIMTIDYYTWEYLNYFPQYQDKMYVDATVKKYFDKHDVMQDVKNIFSVDKHISREWNGKLFLNRQAPTCLHCALNLCLIKLLENKTNTGEDGIIRLWGHALTPNWKHCYNNQKTDVVKKDKIIQDMRNSVYNFKKYVKLTTLNKQCDLELEKEDLLSIVYK